jgi:hypothetical protein
MAIQVDYYNKIIEITSPDTSIDLQTLHDFIEDERTLASPRGMSEDWILQPEGKIEDPTNPGVYSQIILVLNSNWQIQFWGGSGYTRIYGGKLVGGVGDEPIKATGTAGDITVLESPVDGLTVVSGSAVTQQDKDDIVAGVWDALVADYADAGSFGLLADSIGKLTGNKVTKSGDVITIYDDDDVTPWRQYDLASGGRVEV